MMSDRRNSVIIIDKCAWKTSKVIHVGSLFCEFIQDTAVEKPVRGRGK